MEVPKNSKDLRKLGVTFPDGVPEFTGSLGAGSHVTLKKKE